MIIAQLSIAPVGAGTSLGKYVRRVIDVLSREEKIRFETNAMSTVIESPDLETLFDVIQKAHRAVLEMGIKRVITESDLLSAINGGASYVAP